MNVVIEKPITWLESDRDGSRNRLMYANLTLALRSIGANVHETETYYGNDFLERTAPIDGILISYHSVGNAPNIWRLKETPIPFFYNLDKLGYSGWSELAVEKEKHEHIVASLDPRESEIYCKTLSEWLIQENLSKYSQSTSLSPLSQGFTLYPMQVRNDAVAIHNRLDPLDVLRTAAHICRKRKQTLLVKRHPYCTSPKVALHLKLTAAFNKYVQLTSASITSLLPACDRVIAGNSGVGLEALVYGKPVHSFARSEYEMATYQIHTHRDIEEALSGEPPPQPNGQKFAYYFLSERSFDARNVDDIIKKLKTLVGL